MDPEVATPPTPADVNGDGTGEEKRTYTQNEFNAIIGERATRAARTAIEKLLKDLGVDSPEAAKEAIKTASDLRAAQMTELEKAQAEAAQARKEKEEAEQARQSTEAKALERLMRSAVVVAAARAGFNDPDDAWLLIDRTAIKAKDDDTFEGIDKALEAVVKAKPYLVKAAQPSGGTPRRRPTGAPREQAGEPAQAVKPIIRL